MSTTLKNIIASTPTVTRGKSVFVNGDPKGKNILYASGNTIVIRNMKDLAEADIYYEHPAQTTVARYSPSGFYIASGDVQGNVRIWDTTQKEHPLKIALRPISSTILDIAWTADSQRLIVVGNGGEKFGVAVFWDSGSSVGEINGHSKQILTCDIKSSRPFRAATGSEDFTAVWFEGPPFKFKSTLDAGHTRFVNCIRFSPDGNKLVSVSSDKKCVVFDGKDGKKLQELNGHTGGVYCVSWSEDNNRVLTASADKTCKIWDTTTGECTKTFTFGNETADQQLGCLWQGDSLLSINLEGEISFLNEVDPSKPLKVVRGHNKPISSIAYDRSTKALYSSSTSSDGIVYQWDLTTGIATPFSGPVHKNKVTDIQINGDQIVTSSMDDSIKVSKISTKTYGDSIGVDSPAQGVSFGPDFVVAASMKTVYLVKGGKIVKTVPAPWEATTISTNGTEVAVGGADKKIHVFKVSGDSLTESHTLDAHRGAITYLSYSPCGKFLASGCANREVNVWDGKTQLTSGWVNHTARVNRLAWSPDSKHIASAGLDSQIYIWTVGQSPIQIKNAHLGGGVNAIVWTTESQVASAGNDGAIKLWDVTFKN
eukprot:gene5137-6397_t